MLLLRTDAIRRLETLHSASAQPSLMERAGLAAADVAGDMLEGRVGPVLVLAGSGNNGGDAYVCARHLQARGHTVIVASLAANASLPADAAIAREAWLAGGGIIVPELPHMNQYALAIDGLFGIGLTRPIEGRLGEWIDWLNALDCPVLALDIPSGLDADSGAVLGRCVNADRTVTFLAAKPGLFTLDGRDHTGQIHCATLDLDATALAQGEGRLIEHADFHSALKPRRHNSHKGSHGSAGLIGGAAGMAGAALLAGRAALQLGAGRVYLGMLAPLLLDFMQPELMLREPEDAIAQASAIGIGPGLGQDEAALKILRYAISSEVPLALDADALNLIATHPVLTTHIMRRRSATVMTPHPSEAARLLGCSTAEIQADRIEAACKIARRFKAIVLLKGSGSIVALPNTTDQTAHWFINGNGNPGLATAGSGDVLLGLVTALLAQGNEAKAALLAAVHLHATAADELVASGCGPIGLTAGELIPVARRRWNHWVASR